MDGCPYLADLRRALLAVCERRIQPKEIVKFCDACAACARRVWKRWQESGELTSRSMTVA